MTALYQVWLLVTTHGYSAVVEFIVDMGDHVVTHLIAVIVLKAGVVHVGYKVVKRVRARKVNVTPQEKAVD